LRFEVEKGRGRKVWGLGLKRVNRDIQDEQDKRILEFILKILDILVENLFQGWWRVLLILSQKISCLRGKKKSV